MNLKTINQEAPMEKYIASTDSVKIYYTETTGDVAVVFVHGWLGNKNWWKLQEEYLHHKYKIVRMDLGGHGQSDKRRQNWTGKQYAEDIKAVISQLNSSEIILVGHSMSGAYALEASTSLRQVKGIILVDTLHDLDQVFTVEQAEQYMFGSYRKDFDTAIHQLLPQYLFVEKTPEHIKKQIQDEFLKNEPQLAIDTLRPLYEMDIRAVARRVKIPVRAINSDATPTAIENNQKYFCDFSYEKITETGHYPMLEKPTKFNKILDKMLVELTA